MNSRTETQIQEWVYIFRNGCIILYVWQPAARGHRAYTDLSAARSGAVSYMYDSIKVTQKRCQCVQDYLTPLKHSQLQGTRDSFRLHRMS